MKKEVDKCLEVLNAGGIILYPTDTIWGLGCDATNEKAVAKIFELKARPEAKSLIILLDHTGRLSSYIRDVPQQAYELMELSEQPLTIILDGAKNLAPNVIAADGSIGVRIVMDDFCRNLITRLRKPLVSTSANISGQPAPASFFEISEEIKSGVDYIVNLRQNEKISVKPSTIMKVTAGGVIKFIRK